MRRDRGVPRYLAAWAPEKSAQSLLLAEVDSVNRAAQPDFDTRFAVFDYVWLTPRVDDIDPCERFREQLERMRDPT